MYSLRQVVSRVLSKNTNIIRSVRNCSDQEHSTNKWAFNDIESKKGLFKPKHTIEEQIRYMESDAYKNTYKGLPIFKWYKRNVRGQEVTQSKPRLFCIDKEGKFNLNHACPVCRDEYLFFDYRVCKHKFFNVL